MTATLQREHWNNQPTYLASITAPTTSTVSRRVCIGLETGWERWGAPQLQRLHRTSGRTGGA